MYDPKNIKALHAYGEENSRTENKKNRSEPPEQIIEITNKTANFIVKYMVQEITPPLIFFESVFLLPLLCYNKYYIK